jgi:putative ABC transport system permease protein
MQEEIGRKIATIQGVSSVGLGSSIPMDGSEGFNPVFAQDRTYTEGQLPPICRFKFVAPGYLRTLGTPLVAGREFTWTEVYNKIPVALVSERMARDYWHDPVLALGKRVRATPKDDWCEVIGVAGDVHDEGVSKEAPASVYCPILMRHFWNDEPLIQRTLTFTLRTPRAGSEGLMKEVRQAVWAVDANLPLANVHTLEYFYRKSMARTSFTLVMLGVAGAMALLLGTVGLYGVIAYSVSQRTREIGIRLALGAQQQQVTGMFVRHGLWLAGVGVACGLGAAIPLMRLMSALLFEVKPIDPFTYGVVSIGLVATGALASYLPSRRVASVDPVGALRAE